MSGADGVPRKCTVTMCEYSVYREIGGGGGGGGGGGRGGGRREEERW